MLRNFVTVSVHFSEAFRNKILFVRENDLPFITVVKATIT